MYGVVVLSTYIYVYLRKWIDGAFFPSRSSSAHAGLLPRLKPNENALYFFAHLHLLVLHMHLIFSSSSTGPLLDRSYGVSSGLAHLVYLYLILSHPLGAL